MTKGLTAVACAAWIATAISMIQDGEADLHFVTGVMIVYFGVKAWRELG